MSQAGRPSIDTTSEYGGAGVKRPLIVMALLALAGVFAAGGGARAVAQTGGGAADVERGRFAIESDHTDVEALRRLAEEVGRVPGGLLNTVVDRDRASAREAVAHFLTRGNAPPKRMAARAIALINQVRGDPRVRTRARTLALASMISDLVAETVNAPRVIEVLVSGDYIPPANARAYDLGGRNAPVALGFEPLTPDNNIVTGRRKAAFAADGPGPLLGDGVADVQRLAFALPNGTYRVILLQGGSRARHLPPAPFGEILTANSTHHYLGEAPPRTWIGGARLVRPALSPGNEAARVGLERLDRRLRAAPRLWPGGTAAAIAFKVDVVHGYLTLRFQRPGTPAGVNLAAVLVEPAGQASSLIHGEEVVRAEIARQFLSDVKERYKGDSDMAAALAALAASMAPGRAAQIVTASMRINPAAARRIAEVVSRVEGVDAGAVQSAIRDDPALSRDTKVAALAALPGGND